MHLASVILAGLMPAAMAAPASEIFPEPTDIRLQEISRQAQEQGWPFAANAGTLACMRAAFGLKVVIFVPGPDLSGDQRAAFSEIVDLNYVVVSTDPLQLWMDAGKSRLFAAGLTIEDKIRQLGPFATMGKKLCDQPKGTVLGPSEL